MGLVQQSMQQRCRPLAELDDLGELAAKQSRYRIGAAAHANQREGCLVKLLVREVQQPQRTPPPQATDGRRWLPEGDSASLDLRFALGRHQ